MIIHSTVTRQVTAKLCMTVASTFIADGPVFWEEDAQGKQTATDALPDGIATDRAIQLVVLIDRGSASA